MTDEYIERMADVMCEKHRELITIYDEYEGDYE